MVVRSANGSFSKFVLMAVSKQALIDRRRKSRSNSESLEEVVTVSLVVLLFVSEVGTTCNVDSAGGLDVVAGVGTGEAFAVLPPNENTGVVEPAPVVKAPKGLDAAGESWARAENGLMFALELPSFDAGADEVKEKGLGALDSSTADPAGRLLDRGMAIFRVARTSAEACTTGSGGPSRPQSSSSSSRSFVICKPACLLLIMAMRTSRPGTQVADAVQSVAQPSRMPRENDVKELPCDHVFVATGTNSVSRANVV